MAGILGLRTHKDNHKTYDFSAVCKPDTVRLSSSGRQGQDVTLSDDSNGQSGRVPESVLTSLNKLRPVGGRTGAHMLADQLRQSIVSQSHARGSRLCSAADIEQHSGFSRGVVREALRILESAGVIEVRPGVRGGVFVGDPGHGLIGRSIDLLMNLHDVPKSALVEARQEMESVCCKLAAGQATDEDIRSISECADDLDITIPDEQVFVDISTRFHILIARATHNPVIEALMLALLDISYRSAAGTVYLYENKVASIEAHHRIAAAISVRDADLAFNEMREHIQRIQ